MKEWNSHFIIIQPFNPSPSFCSLKVFITAALMSSCWLSLSTQDLWRSQPESSSHLLCCRIASISLPLWPNQRSAGSLAMSV